MCGFFILKMALGGSSTMSIFLNQLAGVFEAEPHNTGIPIVNRLCLYLPGLHNVLYCKNMMHLFIHT